MSGASSETEEAKKSEVQYKNDRFSFASGSSAPGHGKAKQIKRANKLLTVPLDGPQVQGKPSETTVSMSQQPSNEIVIVEDFRGSTVEPELGSWSMRRARAKSVYLSCFAGVDSIYFIIRLVIFLRVDIFHDTYEVEPNPVKISVDSTGKAPPPPPVTKIRYFCDQADLEAQCAWIFSVTWLCYILADISLILSIIWLSLKLCYAYIFMKTTSIIIHFLGLLTYGYNCLSQKFYIETGVFFIVHLPLQIFGTKRTKNYALSLKTAAMEKTILRLINENQSDGLPLSPNVSGNVRSRPDKSALQRRKSYQVVRTVDG